VIEPQRLAIKTGDTDSLISVAQVISKKMGGPGSVFYKDWLSQTIGSIEAKDFRLLRALHRLRPSGNILATTNYDDLLVEGQPDLQPVTWGDGFNLLRVARGEAQGVLFLHGYWRRDDTVVLDWRSYLELVDDADARSNIEAVWKMTTWLYVGCGEGGLTDPDLGKLVEQFGPSARNAQLWDYFLAREADASALEALFRKRGANIRVVVYGANYDDLPAFLEQLAGESVPPEMQIGGAVRLVELMPITPGFRDFRQAGEDVFASLRPSFDEFRRGLVYRPRLVDDVVAALNARNWAWLRGVSATGKTTIALHVALETSIAGPPALYLDLSDELDISAATEEMSASSTPCRLFVIDNVHINPRGAASLLRNWEKSANGSRMLLLGWPLDEAIEKRHLVAYRSGALEVGVTEDDLEGIYVTLRQRLQPIEASVPKPPQAAVREWFSQFGADLVAFQLALAAALRTTLTTDWSLDETAAERYIREKYLDSCSLQEHADLIRLALFAELGLALPEQCLSGRFDQALSAGIVRRSTHGRYGQQVRFSLWHQALGRCLLSANRERVDQVKEFSEVSVASPLFGSSLGERLWQVGKQELARVALRSCISSGGLLRVFGDNLNQASRQLRILNTVGVLGFAEASSTLTANAVFEDLEKLALATPLHILVAFLRFVASQNELGLVYESLVGGLVTEAKKPTAENQLLEQALATPLHFLPNFLGFVAKQNELKPVYTSLTQGLVAEAAKAAAENRLLARALATELGCLASFLAYVAKQNELKPVYESLARGLVAKAGKAAADKRLLEQALATKLEGLGNFLEFAAKQSQLRPVYESLAQALTAETAKPAAENRLLAQTLATPLECLAYFLGLAAEQNELKQVYESLALALVTEVAKPDAENKLLTRALATPLDHLANFLGFVAEHNELKAVYESLAKTLIAEAVKPATENRLLAQALRTPLEHLANFLGFVAKQNELKSAYDSLAQALVTESAKPAAENQLLAQALITSLEHLANFLAFAAMQDELKSVHKKIASLLLARADLIALKILRTRFAQTLPLLSVEPQLGTEAIGYITNDEWTQSIDFMAKAPVMAVGRFLAKLAALGFSEKAKATATALVQRAESRDWDNPRLGIFDLSAVLRFSEADANEKTHLVESIATPRWLTYRYYQHPLAQLATGLFHLLAHQNPALVERFVFPALRRRVRNGLLTLRDIQPIETGALLRLWAAAELMGAGNSMIRTHWPEPNLAEELVDVHYPHPLDFDGMGYIQQHLWMGIRLFARHHPSDVHIKASLLEDALIRWKKTASDPDRTEVLKSWDAGMIRWLERSLQEGALMRDEMSLRIAVAPLDAGPA
jgi:hypothetical protein